MGTEVGCKVYMSGVEKSSKNKTVKRRKESRRNIKGKISTDWEKNRRSISGRDKSTVISTSKYFEQKDLEEMKKKTVNKHYEKYYCTERKTNIWDDFIVLMNL